MSQLDAFLRSNFSNELQFEFGSLIDELGLRPFFNNTISILENADIDKDEIVIAALSAGLLRNINYKLAKFQTVEDKISRQRSFGILLERLLILLISKKLKDTDKIFDSLERSLMITCLQQGYDHRLMKKLFDFDGMRAIIYNLKAPNTILVEKGVVKPQKYVWLQKGNLPEFVDVLAKNNYIKSKKELFDLFHKGDEDVLVRWNKEKKHQLAHILNRLFGEGFVKIEGNKGYFSYAEKHFVSYERNPFAPNSLKKLSSSITKRPESYQLTISEVDEIIRSILK